MTEYELFERPSKVYSDDDLINWTAHHPPARREIIEAHQTIRQHFLELLVQMNDLLPEGNDKVDALKAIRHAMYLCNSTVACAQATMDVPHVPFPEGDEVEENYLFSWQGKQYVRRNNLWHLVEDRPVKGARRDDPPKVTTRYGDKQWSVKPDPEQSRLHVWHNKEWTADPSAVAIHHPEFPGNPNHGDTVMWEGDEYVYVGEPGPKNVPLGWAKPMYFKGKQA